MREINEIIVHCSATPPSLDIGADEIRLWHTRDNGWSDIGYHFVIRRDGTLEPGRDVSKVGAHAKGHNSHSIGICLIGGVDASGESEANFTFRQYAKLVGVLNGLKKDHPGVKVIQGHCDLEGVDKDCPSFNIKELISYG